MKNWLWIALLSIGWSNLALSQGTTVQAKIDSTTILIGDQVKLSLLLTKEHNQKIAFPVLPDTLGPVEIQKRPAKIDTLGNNGSFVKLKEDYTITCFDSGLQVIPPLPFLFETDSVPDTLFTDSVFFRVNFVPVDTAQHTIMDIKAPLGAPFSFTEILPYILIALGAVLLTLLVIYVVRRIRKHKPIIPIPEKPADPPHVIALRELDHLKGKKLWQNNRVKEYHSALTEILRRYIESRFGIPAMEITSFDLLEHFNRLGIVDKGLVADLGKILTMADFVKFAKHYPLPDENEKSMTLSYSFVEKTKQEIVEETPVSDDSKKEEKEVSDDERN